MGREEYCVAAPIGSFQFCRLVIWDARSGQLVTKCKSGEYALGSDTLQCGILINAISFTSDNQWLVISSGLKDKNLNWLGT
jgi:hypothetical protein